MKTRPFLYCSAIDDAEIHDGLYSQQSLMILLLSCRANQSRWPYIRDGWLEPCGIPFVIVVGDPIIERGSHLFDDATRVLAVGCDDGYDELPHKVAFAVRAIQARFAPSFLFKIDDDVLANPSLLANHTDLPMTIQYAGHVIQSRLISEGSKKFQTPQNRAIQRVDATYCGGPAYFLRAAAIKILALHMDPSSSKYEDVAVGMTLHAHGISPQELHLYTDSPFEFNEGKYVMWHDGHHMSEQNKLRPRPLEVTVTRKRALALALVAVNDGGFEVSTLEHAVIPPKGRAPVSVGVSITAPSKVRVRVQALMSVTLAGVDVCGANLVTDDVVVLHNHTTKPFVLQIGTPIAQITFDMSCSPNIVQKISG